MDNIAYLITKEHFEVEEVNFELLKSYTNNVILQYEKDFTKFRRALFELDRLDFNIGIHTEDITSILPIIAGIKIKLGVWIDYEYFGSDLKYINEFRNIYFITGIRFNLDLDSQMPRWGTMGDIENSEIIKLDFIRKPILSLKLNTDFVKIYNENNLKPVLSTEK